jgi:DNA-binding NarL/FixJ family response regulator
MKFLLADEHQLFREGLALQLGRLADDVEVVEAGSFDEVLKAAEHTPEFDAVILETHISGMRGAASIRALRQRAPNLPIIVVSAAADQASVREAIEAGARGFIPKTSSGGVALGAIRLVLSGGIYVPPSVLATPTPSRGRLRDRSAVMDAASLDGVTRRQRQVLELVAQGKSNRQIASELGVREGTVRIHISAILRALGVRNRTEAALKATALLRGHPGGLGEHAA